VGASRVLVAFGIVLAGLVAAWPFRQYPSPPAIEQRPAATPMQLTIRRPDVPLELAPRIDVSPAEGLHDEQSSTDIPSKPPAVLPIAPNYALENLAPPPTLPVAFHPSLPPSQPNDWRPDAIVKPAVQPRPPRPYRIRDRDTLELIAERLLGDKHRANELFEANRNVLARPDLLPVGITIMLPARETLTDLQPVAAPRPYGP
jgi:nucleoid-associated protein YgaU